jgi:ubiquitin carboxyl-terminal hydrolase 4/11
MNTALQCLLHCKDLTEYFQNGRHENDLNTSNPLGMNGVLAQAYGELVAHLFNPNKKTKRTYKPIEFKKILDRFAPNFSQFTQEDSLDFLSFLLDGLHEDLNKVHEKIYVERNEMPGTPPSQAYFERLGREAWEAHKLRNDSVIVDKFQGLYKSSTVCSRCKAVTLTFDAFADIRLPLPTSQMYVTEFTIN